MARSSNPLTEDNHLTVDARMSIWSPLELGESAPPPTSFVRLCLEPKLAECVPFEISQMFDRAKAVMSYGVYHYPLFTAGAESISIIEEAALFHFVCANGYQGSRDFATFGKLLKYCIRAGLIGETQGQQWEVARQLRNMSAHRRDASLLTPSMALNLLHTAKDMIDDLFV